jgi:nitrite reductase/ring-hydroxylating ferredoxin subunit
MSDALNYLLKVRPEPFGHYFKFLKEAGRHLDPKTRDLISVITKVHSRTERGLRQYLLRALRDGCTAQEVLDALLMAFPTLGLARITWAIDVILAMDLPEFRPEALGAAGAWHDLGGAADIGPGEVEHVERDGHACFVHHAPQGLVVYDGRCPHEGTDIPATACKGTSLTCPKHGWVFDLVSGDCTGQGNRPLTRRETKIENGRLLAFW